MGKACFGRVESGLRLEQVINGFAGYAQLLGDLRSFETTGHQLFNQKSFSFPTLRFIRKTTIFKFLDLLFHYIQSQQIHACIFHNPIFFINLLEKLWKYRSKLAAKQFDGIFLLEHMSGFQATAVLKKNTVLLLCLWYILRKKGQYKVRINK